MTPNNMFLVAAFYHLTINWFFSILLIKPLIKGDPFSLLQTINIDRTTRSDQDAVADYSGHAGQVLLNTNSVYLYMFVLLDCIILNSPEKKSCPKKKLKALSHMYLSDRLHNIAIGVRKSGRWLMFFVFTHIV